MKSGVNESSDRQRQREVPKTLLDFSKRIRIMECEANNLADVAELADAQVSEACGGNIVEVQVLSSAPGKTNCEPRKRARFFVCHKIPTGGVFVTGAQFKPNLGENNL